MSYQAFDEIIKICKEEEKEFWQVILEDDMSERNVTREESLQQMHSIWDAMLLAAATYDGNLKSKSSLVGGDGARMEQFGKEQSTKSLCGA